MERRNAVFVDWVNLILGVVLFISPWIFGFAAGVTTWNAMIAGVVIGVIAIAALVSFAQWEEWVNLIIGLWVLISPWVLGFSGAIDATWVHVLIGLAVAVLAGLELWLMNRNPPTAATPR